MPNLDSVLREMQQTTARAHNKLAAAMPQPLTTEALQGLAHLPGDKVLDLVTGQQGEIISGTRQGFLVQDAAP